MNASQWKTGKWAGVTFTADQKKARIWWQRQQKDFYAACDALRTTNVESRKQFCERAGRAWDRWERARQKAEELFPEVSESFTIASMTMAL